MVLLLTTLSSITKLGKGNVKSLGGNTFNGFVSLVNTARGTIVLSDSLPDIYNSKLIVNNTDTGTFYLAHRGIGNQFNGEVNVYGKKIYFNYYGTANFSGNIHCYSPAGEIYFGFASGSSTMISGKTITLDSTISSGSLYFQNFTQSGGGTMVFALTGSSHLYFKSGSVFNAALACSAPSKYSFGWSTIFRIIYFYQ